MGPRALRAAGRPLAVLALLVATPAGAAGERSLTALPGYVDASPIVRLAGEEAVKLEINIHGALLRTLTKIHRDLYELAGGLESIHAVVVELPEKDLAGSAKVWVRDTEKRLRTKGWQRLALVRESDSEVQVHVLGNDEDETIRGLVVMIVDTHDRTLTFANVAGVLDLAALERLGSTMGIPGLDELDLDLDP